MLAFVVLGGLLVVRKLGRFDMVLSFLIASVATIFVSSLFAGTDFFGATQKMILYSPLFFLCLHHSDRAADHSTDSSLANYLWNVNRISVHTTISF